MLTNPLESSCHNRVEYGDDADDTELSDNGDRIVDASVGAAEYDAHIGSIQLHGEFAVFVLFQKVWKRLHQTRQPKQKKQRKNGHFPIDLLLKNYRLSIACSSEEL